MCKLESNLAIQFIILEIGGKKNHRRKIMLTMVTKLFYNRVLTAKPMLGGVTLLNRMFHCFFSLVFIVAVTTGAVSIAVPKESTNKPHKQHQRHNDGHDHISDLITKVHENTNDIECFCQR